MVEGDDSDNLSLSGSSAASKTLLLIGTVSGLVPFVMSTVTSSASFVNGKVTSFEYRDNIALVGGVVALLCGVITAIRESKPSAGRTKRLVAAIALIALGGFQIARGIGVFASPQNAGSRSSISITPSVADVGEQKAEAICGSPKDCNRLGQELDKTDPPKALAAYEWGCTPDGPGNCFNAALKLRDGEGVPKDMARAVKLFETACGYKMWLACSNLGALHSRGEEGVRKDEALAEQLYRSACEHDDGLGCSNLAAREQDAVKRAELYSKACDLKLATACDKYGVMLYMGEGVKKDEAAARGAFERACKAPSEPQCYNLAVAHADGLMGVKQDFAKAHELYTQSCEAGEPASCHNLGWLFYRGQGVAKDVEVARAWFEKMCGRGHDSSCKSLEAITAKADTPKPAPKKPAAKKRGR